MTLERAVLVLLLAALPCPRAFGAPRAYESGGEKFVAETLLKRPDVIWGFDFLPDGRVVFSERSGKMGLYDPKLRTTIELRGLPRVHAEGQGGLLDVKVHPDFARTSWIYFTYSQPVGKEATTTLARGKLVGKDELEVETLLSTTARSSNQVHYGSRIVFNDQGQIFLSVGERGEREQAQKLDNHQGKILRLTADGKPAPDNPFAQRKGALAEVWSYGHRNPQGLTFHPSTGDLWEAEMGPRGGDELNVVKRGANYGWPVVTFGTEYHGPKIGEGSAKNGVEAPVAHWVPSISPSGLAFYTGDAFPKWKGDLFVATLSGMHLRRLKMDGTRVVAQEELLKDLESRFRQVRANPDGGLCASTDDGAILCLRPAK